MYGLDADSGKEVWRFATWAGILSSPAIDSRMVFIGSIDGNPYALDQRTGSVAFHHRGTSVLITGGGGPVEGLPSAIGVSLFSAQNVALTRQEAACLEGIVRHQPQRADYCLTHPSAVPAG